MTGGLKKTARTEVRREKSRGSYEREQAYRILDEGLVAHVGLNDEVGPVVIPMAYARRGDELLLHGSIASRLLEQGASGVPICATVTLLDGVVVSRSWFNHSMNYRSVVVMGRAVPIDDGDAKQAAMRAIVEHLIPASSDYARAPTPQETNATRVLRLDIDEASVKVRSGPPKDAASDADRPGWTGVIPLAVAVGEPIGASDDPLPDFARNYRRPGPGPGSQD